jgi:hypothetical protein
VCHFVCGTGLWTCQWVEKCSIRDRAIYLLDVSDCSDRIKVTTTSLIVHGQVHMDTVVAVFGLCQPWLCLSLVVHRRLVICCLSVFPLLHYINCWLVFVDWMPVSNRVSVCCAGDLITASNFRWIGGDRSEILRCSRLRIIMRSAYVVSSIITTDYNLHTRHSWFYVHRLFCEFVVHFFDIIQHYYILNVFWTHTSPVDYTAGFMGLQFKATEIQSERNVLRLSVNYISMSSVMKNNISISAAA